MKTLGRAVVEAGGKVRVGRCHESGSLQGHVGELVCSVRTLRRKAADADIRYLPELLHVSPEMAEEAERFALVDAPGIHVAAVERQQVLINPAKGHGVTTLGTEGDVHQPHKLHCFPERTGRSVGYALQGLCRSLVAGAATGRRVAVGEPSERLEADAHGSEQRDLLCRSIIWANPDPVEVRSGDGEPFQMFPKQCRLLGLSTPAFQLPPRVVLNASYAVLEKRRIVGQRMIPAGNEAPAAPRLLFVHRRTIVLVTDARGKGGCPEACNATGERLATVAVQRHAVEYPGEGLGANDRFR